jgi:hypothetical protein
MWPGANALADVDRLACAPSVTAAEAAACCFMWPGANALAEAECVPACSWVFVVAPAVVPMLPCSFMWPGANTFADVEALVLPCTVAPAVAPAVAATVTVACPLAEACAFWWPGALADLPGELLPTDAEASAPALALPLSPAIAGSAQIARTVAIEAATVARNRLIM